MRLIRGINNIHPQNQGVVLSIGNFDGIHLGHQKIISDLKKHAKNLGAKIAIMLFEPHTKKKLNTNTPIYRLTSLKDKLILLEKFGVDIVICQTFTKKFSQLPANIFIDNILVKKLKIQHIIVGDDFRFGRNRQGDFNMLQKAGKTQNFSISKTQTLYFNQTKISSTRIRKTLQDANFSLVNILLGHSYKISATVIKGQGLGKTLGFPTANLNLKRCQLALKGVFVARAHVNNKSWMALVNIGIRPTVGGEKQTTEAYLLNFKDNLYNKKITIEFLKKIREEKKFANIKELKKAIIQDKKIVESCYIK